MSSIDMLYHGQAQLALQKSEREPSVANWPWQSRHIDKKSQNHVNLLYKQTNQIKLIVKAQVAMAHGVIDAGLNETIEPAWILDKQRVSSSQDTISNTTTSDASACLSLGKLGKVFQTLGLLDKQVFLISQDIIFCLLQKCTKDFDVPGGRQVLLLMVSNGLDFVAFLGDHLIHLFASCGSLQEAHAVFHKIARPSVHSWHSLISGCIMHGESTVAFDLFNQMQQAGIEPNEFIFTSMLKACGSTGAIGHGRIIHNQIVRQGLASNVFIGSTLVDMYAKCEILDQARRIFDELPIRNVVSWNAMIGGYVKHGYGTHALELFDLMHFEGIKPNRITFLCILKACSIVGATRQGMLIHSHAIGSGLESNVRVGSALIDMYAKCGDLNEACKNFQKLPCRDVVSWGALITGYIHHRDCLSALEMFDKMQEEGIKPDIVTFSCALKACGSLGALERGKQLHDQVIGSGQVDAVVISTLIDMYAKCGSIAQARQVLDDWPNSGVASWGAMIAGYASHGNYSFARDSFECMQKQGLVPNGLIFTSILAACGHVGQVKAGHDYFKAMREDHGIAPSIEHFGCMVDLFGRAGFLNEAEELLESMPIPPDMKSWMSLLTSCRKYRNVKLGRHCFNQVVRMDPVVAAGYALMMQIYAHANMWENVKEIQELRRCSNVWKKPGKAWIEVNKKVHQFVVEDKNHPQWDKIYTFLKSLKKPMEEEGYVPEVDLVFEPVSMQDKEDALCGHCEKLAISFGLLSLPDGATIRVSKNLRMCNDCHNVGKILSKIKQRHIIVSDEYCVHHFKDGLCSCGDFL